MYLGQANQDKFVLNVLKEKRNGYFLEIGSNDPIDINNTYTLEKNYSWKGIMVEYDGSFLDLYKEHRPDSIHIINDATQVDYKNIFEINDVFVEEKFRGNNYSVLLIMNILYYFEQNFEKKIIIKITSETNSDAYFCYKKIFGDEYRKDNRYSYFYYNL